MSRFPERPQELEDSDCFSPRYLGEPVDNQQLLRRVTAPKSFVTVEGGNRRKFVASARVRAGGKVREDRVGKPRLEQAFGRGGGGVDPPKHNDNQDTRKKSTRGGGKKKGRY